MGEAVIVDAVRTPIANAHKGALAHTSVHEVGAATVRAALDRTGIPPGDVDDLVLGEVLQGGGCIARYLAVDVGLPPDVPGMAVQRQCASGLAAVNAAAASIRAGMDRVVLAGGVESMSSTPVTYRRDDPSTPWISPSHPDTPDAPNLDMGITVGENTADRCGITREDQDAWASRSHRRALAAIDEGRFAPEIVAVGNFDTDEHPRRDSTPEKLASLPPIYRAGGTVTAGNASSLNDGSCTVTVVDEGYAARNGLEPLAVIRSWAVAGVPPAETGIAPTVAIPRAVLRAGLTLGDLDLVEINEAFASMAVACTRALGFDEDMVNVNGGAVALGHPVACSGARVLTTLVHELRRRGGGIGVASLCAGGGMGAATVVEVLPPA